MNASKPLVKIIATGGIIAGVGPNRLDYILYPELGEHITIDQSLARIPEVSDIARIDAEDLISVGSTAIGGPEWLSLANRINRTFRDDPEVAGLVVTHGTATLEETAYFLHLTVKTDKPVVITGAMRPPEGARRPTIPQGKLRDSRSRPAGFGGPDRVRPHQGTVIS